MAIDPQLKDLLVIYGRAKADFQQKLGDFHQVEREKIEAHAKYETAEKEVVDRAKELTPDSSFTRWFAVGGNVFQVNYDKGMRNGRVSVVLVEE
jgi:hypothetical protein